VYGGKKAIFTFSLQKVGFQDSHYAWGQKKGFSPFHYNRWASRTPAVHGGKKSDFHCFIIQGGLPGLLLCMGTKNHIGLTFSYTEMGFQDSHCVGA